MGTAVDEELKYLREGKEGGEGRGGEGRGGGERRGREGR